VTQPSSQPWCGYRGPELCSGDPLRMGGHRSWSRCSHRPGRPYVHACLGSRHRIGGLPINVSASATL